jgi:hypothetical protein
MELIFERVAALDVHTEPRRSPHVRQTIPSGQRSRSR